MATKSPTRNEEPPAMGVARGSEHNPNQHLIEGTNTMNSTTTQKSSNVHNQTPPVIAGHEIAMDEHGRFNLNAIFKASGEGRGKEPSYWTVTKQAQELIAEVESQTKKSWIGGLEPASAIKTTRGGAHRGTFAHELLAISYAGWISPRFQLQVNQVFLDYRMGKLEAKATTPALPTPLTSAHQRGLQKAVASRVYSEVPEPHRPSAFKRIYSNLKDRFEVGSYKDIDDSLYTQAVGAVQSMVLEGEWLEHKAENLNIDFPLSDWPSINLSIGRDLKNQNQEGQFSVAAKHLIGEESVSPTLMALKRLSEAGHEVEACQYEVKFLKHFLDLSMAKLETISRLASASNGALRVSY